MTRMSLWWRAEVLVVVASAYLSGCKSCRSEASEADAGDHAQTASLTAEQAAKVLAKVGDDTITLGDYVAAIEHMNKFDRLRYQAPERRKELLEELIDVELLAQEATAKGYDKDPLAQQQLRTVLRDAMLKEARSGAPQPSDIPEADARAYFEAHKQEFTDRGRRRVSLIVTKDEASAKSALDQAKGLTAAQWGELVRKLSVDPQAKANVPLDLAGDFGMISPPGDTRGENPRVPRRCARPRSRLRRRTTSFRTRSGRATRRTSCGSPRSSTPTSARSPKPSEPSACASRRSAPRTRKTKLTRACASSSP